MGSSDSRQKGEYGVIQLELNKHTFTAGETIEGKVHLSINRKYPGKVVYIEIMGTEKTKWKASDGSGSKKHTGKHIGKHDFLVSRSAIQAFPAGEVPVGQYTFPFTF